MKTAIRNRPVLNETIPAGDQSLCFPAPVTLRHCLSLPGLMRHSLVTSIRRKPAFDWIPLRVVLTVFAFLVAGTVSGFAQVQCSPTLVFRDNDSFFDDLGNPLPQTRPQPLVVSRVRAPGSPYFRVFDCQVTSGQVTEFTFSSLIVDIEIRGTESYMIQGTDINGVPIPLTSPIPLPASGRIDSTNIPTLFPGQTTILLNQRVRFWEFFEVHRCSPATNDRTDYEISWPNTLSGPPVCTTTANRTILVRESTLPMTASIGIDPALDLCGITPSDIVIEFKNPPTDPVLITGTSVTPPSRAPGSNMKSMCTVIFQMKQDVFKKAQANGGKFPPADIYLEGGGSRISVANLGGGNFYDYDRGTFQVTLNFATLTSAPLGTGGPLQDGFLGDGIFNEIDDGDSFFLRFDDACFGCANATFYNGLSFTDFPKPKNNDMFFSQGSRGIEFRYFGMCAPVRVCPPHPYTAPTPDLVYRNFPSGGFNEFPVTVFCEADRVDVVDEGEIGDPLDLIHNPPNARRQATLDFYWAYSGTPLNFTPSPFDFSPYVAGRAYFQCISDWSTGGTYALGDRRMHKNKLWYCKGPHTSAGGLNPSDEPGTATSTLIWCTPKNWTNGVRYQPGERLLHNGDLYLCLKTNTGALGTNDPGGVGPNWRLCWTLRNSERTGEEYEASITVPTRPSGSANFRIDGAILYPDPRTTVGAVDLSSLFVPANITQTTATHRTYTLGRAALDLLPARPELIPEGRIELDVVLTDCEPQSGGYTTFTMEIQAICNGCTACPYTIARCDKPFYYHCRGNCGNGLHPNDPAYLPSTAPQGTRSFSFDRNTFGFSPTGWDPFDPTPGQLR